MSLIITRLCSVMTTRSTGAQRLDHLLALLFRHECKSFFLLQPVVVVENDHEFVAKRLRALEHPDMADMDRIEAAATPQPLFFFWMSYQFTEAAFSAICMS